MNHGVTLLISSFLLASFMSFQQIDAECVTLGTCESPSSPEFVDSSGRKVEYIFRGEEVNIQINFAYSAETEGKFVYILLIKDPDGFTEILLWVEAVVKENQTATPAIRWVPKKAEQYIVDIFIWDDLATPKVLFPSRTTEVTVSPLVKILEGSFDPEQKRSLDPQEIKVMVGVNNTVVWLNNDSVAHAVSVQEAGFYSGMVQPTKTSSHTFTNPGIYKYPIVPEDWLRGKVVVIPAITEDKAIETAKNSTRDVDITKASIEVRLFFVEQKDTMIEVDKHNLEPKEPYPFKMDHTYVWKVTLKWEEGLGLFYDYTIDANNGKILYGTTGQKNA